MAKDEVQTCDACGASIYPEHVSGGLAGLLAGQMLCAHCFRDKKEDQEDTLRKEANAEALKPISLGEDMSSGTMGSTAIHGFSGADSLAGGGIALDDESKFRRRLDPRSPFGTRCRTFHAKLTDGAVSYMNQLINEWADGNPDVNIKFANSTIGIFEGKHADPHLIVTVFY